MFLFGLGHPSPEFRYCKKEFLLFGVPPLPPPISFFYLGLCFLGFHFICSDFWFCCFCVFVGSGGFVCFSEALVFILFREFSPRVLDFLIFT